MRLRGLMQKLLPWPSRAERQAAIEQARRQKETATRDLKHAQAVSRDIAHMATANHYANWIARQIIEGRGGNGGQR